MRFFGLTDTGRKRSENEDCFVIAEDHSFAVLADGMGGRHYGEVASGMTVELMGTFIREEMPRSVGRMERPEQAAAVVNYLDEWVRRVNRDVHQKGVDDERYREMGTTVVCAVGIQHGLVVAHVGDSRCYRVRAGQLEQLTDDHSLVNNQLKQGMITADEARSSTQKNIITRAIGTAEMVKPDVAIVDVKAGDRYLMCSDGLTDMVTDEAIAELMLAEGSLEEIAKRLVQAANAAGGLDNITVVLAAC